MHDNAINMKLLGLFGGTFDPVHNGHLRMALMLAQQLSFDRMSLLPCHQPSHRGEPGCSSEERMRMVELAVAECPVLSVDGRELRRQGPSYSVDTLAEIRTEVGTEVSLCWCIGMDSLANLDSWHRWRDILHYAHLVVVGRPGWQPPSTGELAQWLDQYRDTSDVLRRRSSGSVVIQEAALLDISATQIRREIAMGQSPQYLLPETVWSYIKEKNLYFKGEVKF